MVCENGHVVGRVNRDVYLGEINWATAFEWLQADCPQVGSTYVPVCETCGAPLFNGWQVHTPDGWRPELPFAARKK